MSEHKVYKDKKNDLVNKNRTKKILSITKKFMITVAVVLFLNQAIAFVTGYNLIWNGIKYILNAVDIYTEPVYSISFQSDGWEDGEPGSWRINKSAHWTGIDTAEVTFTLMTTEKEQVIVGEEVIPDVILVLDTSLSMEGQKLDKVKEHTKGFVESYLTKHPDKTIAVVDFDDTGRIVISFTSDIAELQAAIDTLVASGNTNYNDALKRVDELMQIGDYAERNVGVLFLTDGVPCIDTPSEVATFKMIKEKYELIAFNGIQYEMGTSITQQLRNISDYYKYANMENLSDVFVELTQKTLVYEKFIITDYVKDKFFYINDVSDIEASYCGGELGTIELKNGKDGTQTVVWDLGSEYKTGACSATIRIKLNLREEYVNEYNKDFYPTNIGAEATSKIEEEDEYTKKTDKTPVLPRIYTVTYENNPPTGCNLPAINNSENHYVFETVPIKNEQPTCSGYLFKGWEFITSVESIGNDKFTMPERDVTIRAKWGKQSISKSMTGTTGEKPSLFEIARADGNNGAGVGIYEGLVSDKFNANSPSENATIYYYTTNQSNNIVFANICWQIVRTTSTGGLKIVYNGEYDPVLKCSDTRGDHNALISNRGTTTELKDSYLYGESYNYDENTKVFILELNLQTRNYSTTEDKDELIGKYTCKNTTGSCTTIYYIAAKGRDASNAYVATYSMGLTHYSQIGPVPFNGTDMTPAYIGYMYNRSYFSSSNNIILDTTLWGADVEYDKDSKMYTLKETKTGGIDNSHHYTCADESRSCSSVRYYYYTNGSSYYYITLDGEENIDEVLKSMFGSSNYNDNINNDINKYSSIIKSYIEDWYKKNIDSKTDSNGMSYVNYLDDIIFCNERIISNYGGWKQNGSITESLIFNNSSTRNTYDCPRLIDQFSQSNSKAKLTYPVGLLTHIEADRMGNSFRNTNQEWWLMSPSTYNVSYGYSRTINSYGSLSAIYANSVAGVRPVVSLKPNTKFSSGNGTMVDPYIIDKPAS